MICSFVSVFNALLLQGCGGPTWVLIKTRSCLYGIRLLACVLGNLSTSLSNESYLHLHPCVFTWLSLLYLPAFLLFLLLSSLPRLMVLPVLLTQPCPPALYSTELLPYSSSLSQSAAEQYLVQPSMLPFGWNWLLAF